MHIKFPAQGREKEKERDREREKKRASWEVGGSSLLF